MKILKHKQQIRVKDFKHKNVITVHTVRGNAADFCQDSEKAYKQAIECNFGTAWSHREASCVSSDYSGKEEELAAAHAAFEDSVEIENGETVQIEGDRYKVRVTRECYSDPVTFWRIKPNK